MWKSAVHRSAVRSNASTKFLQNYAGRRVRQPRTPNTSAERKFTNLIKLKQCRVKKTVSPSTLRKFRLTTTSRVRARRPTLGVRAAPAMPIKLAKTRKQTKLKLSDLTSLNLTFFSQHTKRQVKCPWLCSSHCAVSLALLFCCWHAPCWSIKFQRWSHPNFSENRPCNCCWKINITFSTNMLSSRSHAAKM